MDVSRSKRVVKKSLALIVVSVWASGAHAQTPARLDLTGHAVSADGHPVAASIILTQARLKPGKEESNKLLYPDLPKQVRADGQGDFKIEDLDSAFVYYAVAVAPHCRPRIFDTLDPDAGPLEIRFDNADSSNAAPGTVLRGLVVDTQRRAISGALVSMHDVTRNGQDVMLADRIDAYAVTDRDGNFEIYSPVPFTDAGGSVEAPGFAPGLFEHWLPFYANDELMLNEGAAVKGRLVQGGKPVANAKVRVNMGPSVFTDKEGRFLFMCLPANQSYSYFATMESLGSRGSLPMREFQVNGVGSTNDIGDVTLEAAFTVSGRIQLTDGKPIPGRSRISLGCSTFSGYQDRLSWVLAPDGTFRFAGVPAEKATLYLQIPGYEIKPDDRRMIWGSITNVAVTGNIKDLVVAMEPETRR